SDDAFGLYGEDRLGARRRLALQKRSANRGSGHRETERGWDRRRPDARQSIAHFQLPCAAGGFDEADIDGFHQPNALPLPFVPRPCIGETPCQRRKTEVATVAVCAC